MSSSQPIICVPKRTHRVLRRTHRVCPGTRAVRLSECLLRNSTLETVFRPFPKNPWNRKEKRTKKSKENRKTKRAGTSKQARIGGSGGRHLKYGGTGCKGPAWSEYGQLGRSWSSFWCLVAQCSATPATVAATPPCSATHFQTQISVRHLPAWGGGRCDTKIFRGCSATPVLHLQNAIKSRESAATRVARQGVPAIVCI